MICLYEEQVNSEDAIKAYMAAVWWGLDITEAFLPLLRHRVDLGTNLICSVRKASHSCDVPSLLKACLDLVAIQRP